MEEDIKILEELNNCLKEKPLNCDVYIREDDRQALENLIKGYRELEEWKREKGCSIQEVYELFIPKSKIKEKIEELDKKSKYCAISDLTEYMYKKDILNELLEE